MAQLLTAWSCAKPYDAAVESSPDAALEGDVAAESPKPRDFRVELGWPTVLALDPSRDPRATKMRVVVTDAADPSHKVEKNLASIETGPFDFPQFNTSSLIDVTVEIRGLDDRLLGYGERRRWNLAASATVPVAARQRLLYFTSLDRDDGQLRALGLSPSAMPEPAMDEPTLPPLSSLAEPSALYMTKDGLLLVQAGRTRSGGGGAGSGAISVIETASHVGSKTIAVSFVPAKVAPLGDGHQLLAAPRAESRVTAFALVDVDSGASTDLASGLAGGSIDVSSMAASPDGTRAAAVGSYSQTIQSKPYVFFYDVGSGKVTSRDLSSALEIARGVRFTPDGKSLVVAGASAATDWGTGALLVFDVGPLGLSSTPTKTIMLAANKTRPSTLILHPNGKHAYVGHEVKYAAPTCCGEMRIIDLDSGSEVYTGGLGAAGPDFDVISAVRLPYAPYRVFGGQSDQGNNVHGPVVEITLGGAAPVAVNVMATGDIGTIGDMATPFGTRL